MSTILAQRVALKIFGRCRIRWNPLSDGPVDPLEKLVVRMLVEAFRTFRVR